MAALEHNQAYLSLMHLKAMHPERADQLQDIADCIRNCANDRTNQIIRLREQEYRYEDLQARFDASFCQRVKRFFKPSVRSDLA